VAAASESDVAARLIERLLADPAFRATFRRDPARACREVGLTELAAEMSVGGGKAMQPVADLLNMSQDQLKDALSSGSSLSDLASQQGVSRTDLLAAIRVVAAGDALLAPSVTRRLIGEFARLRPRPPRTGKGDARARPRSAREQQLVGESGERAGGEPRRDVAQREDVARRAATAFRLSS